MNGLNFNAFPYNYLLFSKIRAAYLNLNADILLLPFLEISTASDNGSPQGLLPTPVLRIHRPAPCGCHPAGRVALRTAIVASVQFCNFSFSSSRT